MTMKATGIVRRIDDLGRVVIPKEIRRTLRIREGDPLEIFVDRDGEVILKKYSPIGELSDFAQEYAEALYENIQQTVIVCDRDSVIAIAGGSKKEYMEKSISSMIETSMESRRPQHEYNGGIAEIIKGSPEEYASYIVVPINAGGDPIGAVVIISKKDGSKLGELESKLASTAATFLGKQMEN
ncbi:stage V sporulation protein T [Shimazuella sp. AN120528]|nr:stage V sporulation protein T [Shimazuella soli]